MAKTQKDAILEIALQYRLDGASLDKSVKEATAKYKAEQLKSNGEFKKIRKKDQADYRADLDKRYKDYKSFNTKRKKASSTYYSFIRGLRKKDFTLFKSTEEKKTKVVQNENKKRKSFASGFSNFGAKLGTISSYGLAIAIINKFKQAITYAITKTIEFETAFTDLAVKSGYTNKQMKLVTASIYEVASSTKYSTLEIVDAATALGKLGFEANEVVDVLPNVANVAAATGESLDNTAKIIGKVINAYGYSADQAQVVSDRMVEIFNSSALDLEKFNTAFSYVGAAAASTGTSFDELTAAMAILADRGVTASKIGTGLRNVFTKLGREGDTLRDILVRVNTEQLHFYEVAELVGRRAANQLFIMADGIEEFDKKVKDADDNFNAAAIAAATQMDTFQAKLDVIINTWTNAFAGSMVKDNEEWQASFEDSIDLMDKFISLTDKGEQAFVTRIGLTNPKVIEGFKKTKEAMLVSGEDASKDHDVVMRMIQDRRELVRDRGEDPFYDKYLQGLSKLANNIHDQFGESNTITDFIIDQDEKKEKAVLSKRFTDWQSAVQEAIGDLNYNFGAEASNEFKRLYAEGDGFNDYLSKLYVDGLISPENLALIKSERAKIASDKDIPNEIKALLGIETTETDIDALKRRIKDNQREISILNKGKSDWAKDTLANNISAIQDRMDAIDKAKKDFCKRHPVEAALEGYECDKKSSRTRSQIGKFEENIVEKERYKTAKNELKNQYDDAERLGDLDKQKSIRQDQLQLESQYRHQLNEQFKEYLKKQGDARDSFVKKYPDQADQFDKNISDTKRKQITAQQTGVRNESDLLHDEVELKKKMYVKDAVARSQYNEKMYKLRNEMNKEADTPKKRQKYYDQMNTLTDEYFDKEIDTASKAMMDLEMLLVNTKRQNARNISMFGENAQTTDIQEMIKQIEKLKAVIAKYREEREGKKKGVSEGADFQDFDYFGAAMDMSQNIYDAYATAGNIRLDQLKTQVANELEVIQGRYDEEANIRNGALEAGVISQEAATEAEERANKKRIDKENAANRKLFEAQKKRDKEDAIFTGLSSTAEALALAFAEYPTPIAPIMAAISAAAIASSTAMNIKAISKRKFVPQKYAEGGMVYGASHAAGGVPFTVRGQGGYEMEGGEYIVNKEAVKDNYDELERINGKTKGVKRKFATGGSVQYDSTSDAINEALIEVLSQPVRAYVTDQDLAKSESERRALTEKTSY